MPRAVPKAAARTTPLTVREECALRFATAIMASPVGYDILDSQEPDTLKNVSKSGFRLADAFLDVAEALQKKVE